MRRSESGHDLGKKSSYLQSHSHTGPFPEKTPIKKSQSMILPQEQLQDDDHQAFFTHDEDEVSLDQLSGRETRFSEVTVDERRTRINDLVKDIFQTRPLIEGRGLRSPSLARRYSSLERGTSSRMTSAMTREKSVQTDGVPALKETSPLVIRRSIDSRISVNDFSVKSPTEKLNSTRSKATQRSPSPVRRASESPIIDEATREELKLDLERLEESGGEEEKVSRNLPVVKGISVDYVHANKDSASVVGKKNRSRYMETSGRNSSAASSVPVKHRAGNVPKYLRKRKEEWREEEERKEREKPDPDCPPGHDLLPEEDRVATLAGLNDRFAELLQESNMFPVRSDTLRVRKRRKEIEAELNQLEEAIRTYSRPKVYVKKKN